MTPKAWAWFIVLKISEIVGLCLVGVLFFCIWLNKDDAASHRDRVNEKRRVEIMDSLRLGK